MNGVIEALKGKKTYVALVVGAMVVLQNAFIGAEIPGVELDAANWVNDLWKLVAAAFIRAGVSKAVEAAKSE